MNLNVALKSESDYRPMFLNVSLNIKSEFIFEFIFEKNTSKMLG